MRNIETNVFVLGFAVSFSLPYLLDAPYADLGSKVGFIFDSIAALSFVFALFCVPDCSGRTLEQIDLLFGMGIPMRKFQKAKFSSSITVDDEGEFITGRMEDLKGTGVDVRLA